MASFKKFARSLGDSKSYASIGRAAGRAVTDTASAAGRAIRNPGGAVAGWENDFFNFISDPDKLAMVAGGAFAGATMGAAGAFPGFGGLTPEQAGAAAGPTLSAVDRAALDGAGYSKTIAKLQSNGLPAPGPGEAPPDINEANDPNLATQFQRLRRNARMLGRAGTIKYKGSSSLGYGGDSLGAQMSLGGA